MYISTNNFPLPEPHSVWDCHCLCHLHCHPPHPLGPAHQVEELLSAQGKWLAGWGSAAFASAPSKKQRNLGGIFYLVDIKLLSQTLCF